MSNKIISLSKLAEIIDQLKKDQKSIVHCHGVFDLVHPGHLKHFEDAKKLGDILIVTISPDHYVNKGPGRPVFNERLRLEHLAALQMIDYVAVNDTPSAVETILHLKPNVYVKGKEYENLEDLTGNVAQEKDAIGSVGGKIAFIGDAIYSSTQLLNSYFSVLSPQSENYLKDLRKRYSAIDVILQLEKLKDVSVAVIGEVIIDEYYFCRPLGLANKSVTVNSQYLRSESHLGGAGGVANHIAGFCDNVHFISQLGAENDNKNFIQQKLRPNISCKFFTKSKSPTIVKRRYLDNVYNRLFELSFFDDRTLDGEEEIEIVTYLKMVLDQFDIVLVADYGHGFISTPTLIDTICSAKSYLAINTQTNSANKGFNLTTKYDRANYFCLDRVELQFAMQNQHQPTEQSIIQLSQKISADMIAITEGSEGSTTWKKDGGFYKALALTSETVDATGAGDAYFSMTSICAGSGFDPDLIGLIGNCAGAMIVRVLGNQEPIQPAHFCKFITTLLK